MGVKMNGSFSKSVILEEMMHVTYRSVCSLAYIAGLINEVVNLLWDRLAHNSKDGTFTQCFKVYWPRLHWITRIMNLLGKVE